MPWPVSTAGAEKSCQVGPSQSQDDELPSNECLIPTQELKARGRQVRKGKNCLVGLLGSGAGGQKCQLKRSRT